MGQGENMDNRIGLIVLAASLAWCAEPGTGIERTMNLLQSSSPQHRNTVRVLFYGQSITKQDWWKLVAARLRARYPFADLVIENRAIGGFASPMLRRTLVHDIPLFAPDLIIFHDYGGEPEYEEIIRWIRANTTAEMLLQTDHITWLPNPAGGDSEKELKSYNWHEKHCREWLPEMARKYGLGLADVREPWRQHLAENRLQPKDLLRDGVHLNEGGDALMQELVMRSFISRRLYSSPVIDRPADWRGGRLTEVFEGNRVDLLASRGGRQPYTRARVLIDGKPPSAFPELYAITRPSDSLAVDWPFVIRVDHSAPLVIEDWFLTIIDTDDANSVVRFTVRGSQTGPDGEGVSTERFVSKSGRVVLDPADWHLNRAAEYSKKTTPTGSVCHWRVVPMFSDTYEPPVIGDRTRDYPVTIANGLSNGKHLLELIAETPEAPLLESIRVYRPAP
jgi:hypothetical protein